MQLAAVLAFATAMASTAVATPVKRSYASGWCVLHIDQQTRANNDDEVTSTVYDNDGNDIGSGDGGLSAAEPQSIQSYLPDAIELTQPNDSHDINISYDGYDFGTSEGCDVGDWDDGNQGTRQMDCGFAC